MHDLARQTARSRNRERPPTASARRAGRRDENPQWTAERDREFADGDGVASTILSSKLPAAPVVDQQANCTRPTHRRAVLKSDCCVDHVGRKAL